MAAPMGARYACYERNILIFLFYLSILTVAELLLPTVAVSEVVEDLLLPYPVSSPWPRHSRRYIRACLPDQFNNITSETFLSHRHHTPSLGNPPPTSSPLELKYFAREIGPEKRLVYGHLAVISDPWLTLSVGEPSGVAGGCEGKVRETVEVSSVRGGLGGCLFAVNAGFFNTTDGACMGNVVSDGRWAHSSHGIQNVHFGVKKDGSLFIGYLTEGENVTDTFQQLVGGVIWILRNGESFIDVSKIVECPDRQAMPTLQGFIDVLSARTAIGHDSLGRVVIVQVDGKTKYRGMSLYEFSDLLKGMGVVNAINLDGGGSATAVYRGVVINYPSDVKDGYGSPRNVSSIVCVSDYPCAAPDCGGHGACVRGACNCTAPWTGENCTELRCGPFQDCAQLAGIAMQDYRLWQLAVLLLLALATISLILNITLVCKSSRGALARRPAPSSPSWSAAPRPDRRWGQYESAPLRGENTSGDSDESGDEEGEAIAMRSLVKPVVDVEAAGERGKRAVRVAVKEEGMRSKQKGTVKGKAGESAS